MSLSDSFSDFLTRVRNASSARLKFVDIRPNNMIIKVIEIMKSEGFVRDFVIHQEGVKRTVRIYLKYDKERNPFIRKAVRMSKPGRRMYISCDQIRPIEGGIGKAILTTNRGVLTGERARKHKVGGEYLCYIA